MPDITCQIVYALAHEQQQISASFQQGVTARQALIHTLEQGLLTLDPTDAALDPMELPLGVYAETVSDDYELQSGDRLEIYRPLLRDPKERRRQVAKADK